MALFAVIKDNIVLNVILAESKEDAENISQNTCVEFVDTDLRKYPNVGYEVFEDYYRPTQPSENHVWDQENFVWQEVS